MSETILQGIQLQSSLGVSGDFVVTASQPNISQIRGHPQNSPSNLPAQDQDPDL